jgi:hypothetical protein
VSITTYDRPSISIPAFFNEEADESGSFEVTSATIVEKFNLYVDAGITVPGVPGTVLNDAYTSLSTASWSWTGSGTFSPYFEYTASPGDGVVGSAAWVPCNLTTHRLPPSYPRANQIGQQGRWVVQYYTD